MKIETLSHTPNQLMRNTIEGVTSVSDMAWGIEIGKRYKVTANIAYSDNPGSDLKLDLYQPYDPDPHRPTLMFIHGGGWTGGYGREHAVPRLLPFFQLGWTVLNVGYRRSDVSPAPAAVLDCLQALRWMGHNASHYNINLTQLVVSGLSAGGHLALTTAMISACLAAEENSIVEESGFFSSELLKEIRDLPALAAVINWCGITDVVDLLVSPNLRDWAQQWVGNHPNRMHIAKWVSPISYVRTGLPPVVTIHGDNDLVVPHNHAVRLHQALSSVGVANRLITFPGAGHGLTFQEELEAYRLLLKFLEQIGIRTVSPRSLDERLYPR